MFTTLPQTSPAVAGLLQPRINAGAVSWLRQQTAHNYMIPQQPESCCDVLHIYVGQRADVVYTALRRRSSAGAPDLLRCIGFTATDQGVGRELQREPVALEAPVSYVSSSKEQASDLQRYRSASYKPAGRNMLETFERRALTCDDYSAFYVSSLSATGP